MTKAVPKEVMYDTSATCQKPREGLNDYLCGYKYPADVARPLESPTSEKSFRPVL